MTIQEIAQIYKREWTADIYGRQRLYQVENGQEKYCFMGFYHYKLPEEIQVSKVAQQFLAEVERRIKDKGYTYTLGNCQFQSIPTINDIEGGYEKLMGIIDDILLESISTEKGQKETPAPELSVSTKEQAKELVYA